MVHLVCNLERLAHDYADRWCLVDGDPTGAWATFGTALQAVDERIGLGVMRASMWNAS